MPCRAKRTGVERYCLEIIRGLLALPQAAAHRWRLYVDHAPTDVLTDLPAHAEHCVLPAQRLWTHLALRREVLRRPPDVLFVPGHVIPFVWPRRRLPPSVVTLHDLGYRYYPDAHTMDTTALSHLEHTLERGRGHAHHRHQPHHRRRTAWTTWRLVG